MKAYIAPVSFRQSPQPFACVMVSDERGDNLKPLPPMLNVSNHSPSGFAWGYPGSGPAQLALAICCDAVGVRDGSRLYQHYKARVIQHLDQDEGFTLYERDVIEELRVIAAQRGDGGLNV